MMVKCSGSQECILTPLILTLISKNIMKKNKKLVGEGRQQRREQQQRNELKKIKKQTWYLELFIAACLGASLTLAAIVVHMMLTTEWTW